MKLYTAGADINYIDWKLPILFAFYRLLSYGRITSNNIIGFTGAFKETQWRAWLETIITWLYHLYVFLNLVFMVCYLVQLQLYFTERMI